MQLRASDASDAVKAALEFLILTAARTGEIIGATPAEIDKRAAVWTIPEGRMKAQREHKVPLARAALRLVADGAEGHLFSGGADGAPLSNMAFLMLLRRMGHKALRTDDPARAIEHLQSRSALRSFNGGIR